MSPNPEPIEDAQQRSSLLRRFEAGRAQLRAHRTTRWAWRGIVTAIGAAVVLLGLVMLIFPGPGWAAIFLGLAILATEYAWAQHLLHKAKGVASTAASKALDPQQRRRNLVIVTAVGVALIGLGIWYLSSQGATLTDPGSWLRR